MLNKNEIRDNFSKPEDCYEEEGVASEFENRGLIRLEEKIYNKYLTKAKATVLDIGCFVGRVSFPLARKGFDVMGIDIATPAIKRANELKKQVRLNNVSFSVASATDIPLRDEVFDYILFPYNTIENIPLEELRIKAMQEAHRLLKKDGLVLFSAHNRYYPKYFIGIMLADFLRTLLKILFFCKFNKFLSFMDFPFVKQLVSNEYGSLLWIEIGGKKYTTCYFSRFKDINMLLESSSLKLIERIPVMVHDPGRIDADVLKKTFLSVLKSPIFYYICEKKQV